jgi:RNA polymerase sigma-70 factor (ECF subfamily)
MSEPSEVDVLMRELADGRREVFPRLFQALWAPTLQLCKRLTYSEADAADAAQTAMMKIFERADAYDRLRPALPWALGIAAWECRTLVKRRQRAKETSVSLGDDDRGEAAHAAERGNLVAAALHALGALSVEDQSTLISTYWETEQSASGAAFRKRRERALKRLRDVFGRLYGFD